MDQYSSGYLEHRLMIDIQEACEERLGILLDQMEAGDSDGVADCIEGIYAEVIQRYIYERGIILYKNDKEMNPYEMMMIGCVICINLSCHYSLDYNEFIKEILPELNDQDIRQLNVSIRKYFSNKGRLFPYQVMAYRRNHSEMARTNQKGLLYKPIPIFGKCGMEFDFWMRSMYKKSVSSLIQNQAIVKLKDVIPELDERKLINLQKRYSRLREYTLGELVKEDVETYVQLLNYQKCYILRYAEPQWRIPEILTMERELGIDQIYKAELYAPLPPDSLISLYMLLDAVARVICGAAAIEDSLELSKEEYEKNDVFWEGILKLIMRLSQTEVNLDLEVDYQAEEIIEHWDSLLFHKRVNLDDGRRLLDQKFITPLEKDNDISLLNQYIYISTLICGGSVGMKECECLSAAAVNLFEYQEKILRIADRDGDFDTTTLKTVLQENLDKSGIKVDFSDIDSLYPKSNRDFLRKCKERRYILFYQQIEKALEYSSDKRVDQALIEDIVMMYFRRISMQSGIQKDKEAPRLRKQVKERKTITFWYNELFKKVFPVEQGDDEMIEAVYTRRIEIVSKIKSIVGIDIFSAYDLGKTEIK